MLSTFRGVYAKENISLYPEHRRKINESLKETKKVYQEVRVFYINSAFVRCEE